MAGFKLYDAGYANPVRLSPEQAERLGAKELSEPDDSRPKESAKKADWVEYAEAKGMNAEAAESSTKADLIEQFG